MAPLCPTDPPDGVDATSVVPSLGFDPGSLRATVVEALMFMNRSYRLPLELRDVVTTVRVSPRRLQKVFREDTAETPMSTLRRIRLLHVRQDLLNSTEQRSIGQIAVDAQMLHLGRFAERYVAAFGETPSATVARTRSKRHTPLIKPRRGHFDVQAMEYREN